MIDYQDSDFLRLHIKSILDFYHPNIVDETGGFFHNFKDNGYVFDPGQRHLVSSCRMVFNYCKAYELFGEEEYLSRAKHGFHYIQHYHWDELRQGYNWTLSDGNKPKDQTNHCYGLAFVILCSSAAYELGLEGAEYELTRAYDILESRLWDEGCGLYADEATPDWSIVDSYRGQNANMHACEALLAAYKATSETVYLDRAHKLAEKVAVELEDKSDGLIWEHFTEDLEIDWEYNKDDPKNLYRPWGFQPGHQTEWAKLLLTLYEHRPEDWMVQRAGQLFDAALETAWDHEYGGILYGFAPDKSICDDDKYFWVQAESFAAAARLNKATGQGKYRDWYNKIWDYCWAHMVDHQYGAWYRVLKSDNSKYSDEKSTAGGKCDYHTLGACLDVLQSSFYKGC